MLRLIVAAHLKAVKQPCELMDESNLPTGRKGKFKTNCLKRYSAVPRINRNHQEYSLVLPHKIYSIANICNTVNIYHIIQNVNKLYIRRLLQIEVQIQLILGS